ncbi:MAG: hypothetical protein VKJ05_04345 [Synechococcaceae cyanobacterium]|nr:hypothetical protein [Synechococcaceae cyanobacterium]
MSTPAVPPPDPVPEDPGDPLALPLPPHTVLLEDDPGLDDTPLLALRALRQQLQEIGCDLPLRDLPAVEPAAAPATETESEVRLLQLGRLRVLLVCAPFWAEELEVPTAPWHQHGRLPHLLLGALVERECGAVHLPGVLTAAELHGLRPGFPAAAACSLPASAFGGGLERLFLLAQLVDPEALLPPRPAALPPPLPLRDWLDGVLAEALRGLGGELLPAAAGAFRSGAAPGDQTAALATVAIPLALVAGRIEAGPVPAAASERFRLLLQLCGAVAGPLWLEVRLEPELAGDLLPQRLRLVAGAGAVDSGDGGPGPLTLRVPAGPEPITIALQVGGGPRLRLPSLRFGPLGDTEPGPAA